MLFRSQVPPAVLVGDDRVHLLARDGQLLVQPAPQLAGLIEIRGLGIRRCDFIAQAAVGLVVDLAAVDAERLPPPEAFQTSIQGVKIPRVPIGSGLAALPVVAAVLTTTEGTGTTPLSTDCVKGISNHMGPSIATE